MHAYFPGWSIINTSYSAVSLPTNLSFGKHAIHPPTTMLLLLRIPAGPSLLLLYVSVDDFNVPAWPGQSGELFYHRDASVASHFAEDAYA